MVFVQEFGLYTPKLLAVTGDDYVCIIISVRFYI
jgi:hypothetical protein